MGQQFDHLDVTARSGEEHGSVVEPRFAGYVVMGEVDLDRGGAACADGPVEREAASDGAEVVEVLVG